MAGIVGYALFAFVLMLAVGAIIGGAMARSGRRASEYRRDLRMRSAFDEGNDVRPSSAPG